MDIFHDENWVTVPLALGRDEVASFLISSGALTIEATTPLPVKKRLRVSAPLPLSPVVPASAPDSAPAPVADSVPAPVPAPEPVSTQDTPDPPLVFTGASLDAHRLLASLPDPSLVYFNQSWWRYDTAAGWLPVLDQDVSHLVVDYLVTHRYKVNSNEVNQIVLALSHFCKISVPSECFDQSFFLDRVDDTLSVTPAPGWISCASHIFHVPSVALALFRGDPLPPEFVRPLSSRLFTRGRIPCVLDTSAWCPTWTTFVADTCPDDEQTLQEMFGLSLTFDRSFNVFFVIFGPSGTGKSTCLNVLQRLNSGTVSQVSLGRFGERFYIYPLCQSRLNCVHDLDSIFEGDGSVSLRESVLKSVCSGESMEVERKHRSVQRDYLRSLCVFATNTLPRFADKSSAISDRIRIISFPNAVRNTTAHIRSFSETLYRELPGILCWALRGYGSLLDSGANAVFESAVALDLRTSNDKSTRPEQLFCDDCLEPADPTYQVPSLSVYKAYCRYCSDRGYMPSGMSKVLPLIVAYMGIDAPRQIRKGYRRFRVLEGIRLYTIEETFE